MGKKVWEPSVYAVKVLTLPPECKNVDIFTITRLFVHLVLHKRVRGRILVYTLFIINLCVICIDFIVLINTMLFIQL